MSSAANQVFDTFELLEMILCQLPMGDILMTQRVSPQWNALIQNSLPLQRALYLAPAAGGPIEWKPQPGENFLTQSQSDKALRDNRILLNPSLHVAWYSFNFGTPSWRFEEEEILAMMKIAANSPKMFATQPPYRALGVFFVLTPKTIVVENEMGVTISQLADEVRRFRDNEV